MTLRLALLLVAALSQPLFAQPRPTVSVTLPQNGETVDAGFVYLRANANDVDGYVTRVDYYVDGSVADPAFEEPWDSSVFLFSGRHVVRALAYDNVGYYTLSAPSYFQIGGEYPVNLIRWPYLQSVSATGLVIRWRTDWPTNSVVRFGTNFPLTLSVTNHVRTNEHAVAITGLQPDTRYYYELGTTAETFSGDDDPFNFHTAPTNARPVNIWVIGDAGTGTTNQTAVRDAYLAAQNPNETDLWLMLGDNAYEVGTDDEYQARVFDVYGAILPRVPLWSTIGNHDAGEPEANGHIPYLDIFSLPINGEAGGIASGTERYYSFDYANIHLICLDSSTSDRSPNSPMLAWLGEDLAATDKDWIIAFWHHPPYSKGTHDSDTETQLIQMRQHALPILEDYGVDLVLCGHSHVYERSFLLDGHYGPSYSLAGSMVLDARLGRTNQGGAYVKPAGGLGGHCGTVYTVCGCSGEGGPNSFFYGKHPAMATNLSSFGSLLIRVDGLRLDLQFLRPSGVVDDYFTIDKSQPTSVSPSLSIAHGAGGAKLSWPTSLPAYSLVGAPTVESTTWLPVSNSIHRVGRRNFLNAGFQATNQFFRLRSVP
jgi:hypothetical protein